MSAKASLTRPSHTTRSAIGVSAFSLTLHVGDVPRAVAFYGVLFDQEPAKHFGEYAEFVVADPALVVGLLHVNRYPGMPANRAGIRYAGPVQLTATLSRLELAGVPFTRHGVSQIVVADPDGNLLELFTCEPDLSPTVDRLQLPLAARGTTATWEHRICSPIPSAIPHSDISLDEVFLQATFNAGFSPIALAALLTEAYRVLKPGGTVLVSGLVGDRAVDAVELPGLASRLKSLPVETAPMVALANAGFNDLNYELLGDIICFQVPGIDMRKIRLRGTKPGPTSSPETVEVIYRGPLAEVETDGGIVFQRAIPLRVATDVWRHLKYGPAGRQFYEKVMR